MRLDRPDAPMLVDGIILGQKNSQASPWFNSTQVRRARRRRWDFLIPGLDTRAGRSEDVFQSKTCRKVKSAPLAHFALNPDSPVHHPDKSLGDGQPQTGSTVLPSDGAVDLRKCSENMLQLLLGNAASGIRNREMQRDSIPRLRCDLDSDGHRASFSEFNCVSNQVDDDLPKAGRISHDDCRHFRPHVTQKLQSLLLAPQSYRFDRLL